MSKRLLVAIDVQNDFVEGGALSYRFPEESNTKAVVEYCRKWQKDSLENFLVCIQDTHTENYPTTLEGQKLAVPHCIKGTHGWETVKYGAKEIGDYADHCVLKPTFGTFDVVKWIKDFEHTECEEFSEIQICGYDMAVCVLANAVILRAAFPNKKIVVLKDLCGCINQWTFDAAVTVLNLQHIEIKNSTEEK